jgi:hypothetical protein
MASRVGSYDGERVMIRRHVQVVAFLLITLGAVISPGRGIGAADALPARLSDQEFWKLIERFSEPGGSFRSDNLLSNELQFQHVIPELTRLTRPGRAYVGVGPEQNFTYIAALRPSIAVIVDIRRGNLDLHLLYKALFEVSSDRAEFVSRLFSKPRPEGLTASSTAADIFAAYGNVEASERLYVENMANVRDQLFTKHRFALADEDVRGIEYVYRAFFVFGPKIQYSPFGLSGATIQPTYADLMVATDESGQTRGFLANEEAFGYVKSLQSRNLVVPVVGNFAGAKAIRAVGAYLKEKGTTLSVFYLSNVEEYLKRDGIWQDFCANVSELPLDATSTFIRSIRSVTGDPSDGLRSELGPLNQISNCR